jgi:hypothetical protein
MYNKVKAKQGPSHNAATFIAHTVPWCKAGQPFVAMLICLTCLGVALKHDLSHWNGVLIATPEAQIDNE